MQLCDANELYERVNHVTKYLNEEEKKSVREKCEYYAWQFPLNEAIVQIEARWAKTLEERLKNVNRNS